MRPRVYLDEDVPLPVKKYLERYADVTTAADLRTSGWKDHRVYSHVVRERFDCVVTCNTQGRTAFMAEVLRHLSCREKDLPIPILELREPNSNHWPVLKARWPKHEASIAQELTNLGHKHEARRDEAIARLIELEHVAKIK